METKQANTDGSVSDGIVEYYKRRAMGGVGLIIVEAAYVHPTGKGFITQLGIDRDELIEGLSRIPETVHTYGTKIAIQLIHHGRQTDSQVLGGVQPVAPSPIPWIMGEIPRALKEDEIEELIEAFAMACNRAKLAGFDAAEIHSAHGYLIQSFLSPHSNQRKDHYGGNLEGRMRFALEIIRRSREIAGPDFLLLTRVSHREDHEGGYETDYMEKVVPHMVRAGIDVLDVSVGNYNSIGGIGIPVMDYPMGLNVEGASRLRRAAGIPTIVVGRLNDPELADKVIANKQADMVALGRQLLADPDYVKKIEEGRLEDVRYCLACNEGCVLSMIRGSEVSCSINPECTRELEFDFSPVQSPRTVWIIGGGPAGLSAAYYAVLRGHRVTLFEREQHPGGQWNVAYRARSKGHMKGLIDFYRCQLEKLDVDLKLGSAVTVETLKQGNPDFVVLATGAVPSTLNVPDDSSVQIVQAIDILLDKVQPGDDVVIVGASFTGMEVADYIVDKNRSITLIEALKKAPVSRSRPHWLFLYRRLEEAGANLILDASLEKLKAGSVFYHSQGRLQEIPKVDTLILATGSKSVNALKKDLEEIGVNYRIIGDALEPRGVHEAIHEGAKVSSLIA